MSIEQMGMIKDKTVAVTLGDVNATLSSVVDTALGGSQDFTKVTGCLITCESFDCRIAYGVAASTTLGHIIPSGGSFRMASKDHWNKANVINKTAGSNAVLQVTVETL